MIFTEKNILDFLRIKHGLFETNKVPSRFFRNMLKEIKDEL